MGVESSYRRLLSARRDTLSLFSYLTDFLVIYRLTNFGVLEKVISDSDQLVGVSSKYFLVYPNVKSSQLTAHLKSLLPFVM